MSNLDRYLNNITCGSCLDLLRELPDESIDCCITSPPYYGLRSYAHDPHIWDGDPNCEHEWDSKERWLHQGTTKSKKLTDGHITGGKTQDNFCVKCSAWKGQLGLEPTHKLYLQHLLAIFKEVKRVLKKTGTCFVNLGDSYHNATKWTNKGECPHTISGGNNRDFKTGKIQNQELPEKCQVSIPERFKIAMTDELGWICRNTIIWHKPNCMPASVSDRFTVDFEYLYFFTKSPKYYFEQQFEPLKDVSIARLDRGISESNKWINGADGQTPHNLSQPRMNIKHRKLAGTKYGGDGKGLHDHSGYFSADGTPRFHPQGRNKRCVWAITTKGFPDAHFATFPMELIETPIKAGCPEGGIVLDCFAGSGTTALVALKLNRQYIGLELSQKYVDMANKRLKPYRVQGNLLL